MNNHVHRALLRKKKERSSKERNSTYIYIHKHRHIHTCTHTHTHTSAVLTKGRACFATPALWLLCQSYLDKQIYQPRPQTPLHMHIQQLCNDVRHVSVHLHMLTLQCTRDLTTPKRHYVATGCEAKLGDGTLQQLRDCPSALHFLSLINIVATS